MINLNFDDMNRDLSRWLCFILKNIWNKCDLVIVIVMNFGVVFIVFLNNIK